MHRSFFGFVTKHLFVRRTDEQTDTFLETRLQCIQCSAVKRESKITFRTEAAFLLTSRPTPRLCFRFRGLRDQNQGQLAYQRNWRTNVALQGDLATGKRLFVDKELMKENR